MSTRIYADYAATAPLLDEARQAMAEVGFGNPSSLHEEGRKARAAIDQAREVLSGKLGCLFAEVLFTSSGTEAANMAILGAALAALPMGSRRKIFFSAVEHHCVLSTQTTLAKLGYEVELIPVDRWASVRLERLEEMMSDDVLLVSVMHANNEVGAIQPIFQVAEIAHRYGAYFHCDAVQTFAVWDWQVTDLGADIVTLSAHKIGGPKGVGAIYTRAGLKLHPLLVGGGQEREMRAGTENVAGIAGFAAATQTQKPVAGRYRAAETFETILREAKIEGLHLTLPCSSETLPGHVHLRIAGINAETLLIRLDRAGVSASAGAACSSGSLEPSHVLLACGYSEDEAREGIRFSFGREQPAELGENAGQRLIQAIQLIRT